MSCTFASAARTACGSENISVKLHLIPSFCSCSAGFLAISQHFVEKAPVLLLLGGGVNQAWVCRRIFRLKILDRFKVGGVGHDFGELFQLLELIKLRLFLFCDSSAHKESSVWLGPKTYAPNERSTLEKLVSRTRPSWNYHRWNRALLSFHLP